MVITYESPSFSPLWIVIFLLSVHNDVTAANTGEDGTKPCTFFSGSRNSSPEYNLVNCSWYSGNACCRRTEVTSVFDGMYPLTTATIDCRNRINYIMCYFCSPTQYLWYDRKANICLSLCDSIYEHCHTAKYNGYTIADKYNNGSEFCEGQHFSVVNDDTPCFDFDEKVFNLSPKTFSIVLLFPVTLSVNFVFQMLFSLNILAES